MITIYSIIFNEEILLPFRIKFYRQRFPDCRIIFYDNESTDSSVQIARELNCEVINLPTDKQCSEVKMLEIRNNCWKDAKTDWVCVCDCDELLDINSEQLMREDKAGTSIILSEAYHMVNMEDNFDVEGIKHGFRAVDENFNPPRYLYDKFYLFNRKKIKEINYSMGCHTASPEGKIKYSDSKYKLYHYRFINSENTIKRYKEINLSEENKNRRLSLHFEDSADKIRMDFEQVRKSAHLIM